MDIQLFETSAKDNLNVEEMFLAITEQVLRHKKQTQKQVQTDQNNDTVNLRKGGNIKKKNKCC
ncbi:hypothetical protein pipiens_020075, partial [Culex pipiens pipiens]